MRDAPFPPGEARHTIRQHRDQPACQAAHAPCRARRDSGFPNFIVARTNPMKPIASLLLLALAPALSGPGQAAETLPMVAISTFDCDAPEGHTCYFAIANAAGEQIMHMAVPARGRLPALLPVNETHSYVVTRDKDLTADRTCTVASQAGVFCKRAKVARGSNP